MRVFQFPLPFGERVRVFQFPLPKGERVRVRGTYGCGGYSVHFTFLATLKSPYR